MTVLILLVGTKTLFAQETIKTPPLSESDVFKFQIHNPQPVPNWAGTYLKIHVKDNTEADIVGINSPLFPGVIPVLNPLGEPSANRVSQPFTTRFLLNPTHALNSGIPLPASAPLWTITLHAKNTSPRNNSDTDYTIMWANVIHLVGGQGSTQFPPSHSVWAPSTWVPQLNHGPQTTLRLPNPIPLSNFDNGGTNTDHGHWVHVPFPWHVPPGPGSNFVRNWTTVGLGIEHVPEPMSTAVWLGGGAFCLAMGCWTRRRRRLLD
jgi:hypothetical protein